MGAGHISVDMTEDSGSTPDIHIDNIGVILGMVKKPILNVWWDSCNKGKNPIFSFAKAAKKEGYSYEECQRFIWTANGLEVLSKIKDRIWRLP